MDSGYLKKVKEEEAERGNTVHFFNNTHNMGGCGYILTNHAIQNANGEYFLFFANDDIITPEHMETYLKGIDGTKYDFVYYDTWLDPISQIRFPKLAPCEIGHSEIIVRTDVLKEMKPHSPNYGHDWDLISKLIERGNGYTPNGEYWRYSPTYKVMHIPNFGTKDTID